MDNNNLIVIKQLPIIEERLITIKDSIEKAVADALSLECNDDTYKYIKTVRAEMNKEFNALESKRKELKKSILSPYDAFEKVYKECVSDVYLPAKEKLDERIAEVENGIKSGKEEEARGYFVECVKAAFIDFVKFEDVGLNITMNASKKSLHDKITEFVDKVSEDLKMIDTQEHSAEILVEYKKSLNASQAIITVNERLKSLAEEKARQEELRKAKAEKEAAAKNVDSILNMIDEDDEDGFAAPTAIAVEEESEVPQEVVTNTEATVYKAAFSVETTNRDDLKALVNFMKERGIKYEQLKLNQHAE